jgi:peptidoglycan/xylan/chitin deacetylase (PgdA/CDA1 family)
VSARALILTYHAIEPGPAPLCIDPALFAAHLDCLVEAKVRVVTLDRLLRDLRAGQPTERAVALTFDDGFASAVHHALPLLTARGFPATVFCVAGHLGRDNDWPTQSARVPRLALADAATLASVAGDRVEIGSHGIEHAPLGSVSDEVVRREIADSRATLEDAVGTPVRWFAHPYGLAPGPQARGWLEATYVGACSSELRPLQAGADPFALPRIDAHYLRRPALLRRVLDGSDVYLHARRAGSRLRRRLRADHRRPAAV